MSAYVVTVAKIEAMTPGLREYARRAAELAAAHGGVYVVRGPGAAVLEGEGLAGRSVIILRFPSLAHARGFYDSPEYTAIKGQRAGTGTYDIALFEGVA